MRFLLYSPDSFGLGHIRRNLALAGRLKESFPRCSIRLLTGSPRVHLFDYPDGCDYLALPGVTKDENGHYIAADGSTSFAGVVSRRSQLIEHTLETFRPDLFLVDHAPLGLGGELLGPLEFLRTKSTRVMLGLRDVVDDPQRVRRDWAADGVVEALDRYYDSIVVYGDGTVFDLAAEYDLPPSVRAKTRQIGYIEKQARESRKTVRDLLAPQTGRLVLLTVGGGGDGTQLLRAFLEARDGSESSASYEAVCVTGPMMDPAEQREIKNWIGRLSRVTHLEQTPALFEVIRASDFVVSMGGYNTVYELAAAGVNALIAPREHPRREQLVRARRLEKLGLVQVLPLQEATGARLLQAIERGLERPPAQPGWGLQFSALDELTREVCVQLRHASAAQSDRTRTRATICKFAPRSEP